MKIIKTYWIIVFRLIRSALKKFGFCQRNFQQTIANTTNVKVYWNGFSLHFSNFIEIRNYSRKFIQREINFKVSKNVCQTLKRVLNSFCFFICTATKISVTMSLIQLCIFYPSLLQISKKKNVLYKVKVLLSFKPIFNISSICKAFLSYLWIG